MRITNRAMTNSYMHNLQKNLQKNDRINRELTTGQSINKVSDDPFKAVKVMNMKNEIADTEKFNYNCDEIAGWVDTADGALDGIGGLVKEIDTLLLSVTDVYGDDEMTAIKSELQEKVKELSEIMNSTFGGKYLFSGTATDEKPVDIITKPDGSIEIVKNQNANNKPLKAEVSNGINMQYNTTVDAITNNNGLFDTLNEIIGIMNTDPVDKEQLHTVRQNLSGHLGDILDVRSTIGSKANTIEAIKENNTNHITLLKETLSITREIDYAEKLIEYKTSELAYNASLQVGSKMLQQTILDYIR